MTKLPFAGATALITMKKNCCLYPSMSSCAASSCMSFPKASFASATSASSPTGGGLLSCPSAFKYSAPYHNRRLNRQHPPPSNPALFTAVPNAAGPWSSSRPSPPFRSCSVPRLRSPVPHETNFQNSQTSIPLSARSALLRLFPEKVLAPHPGSLPTAIICYFNHPLPATLLFSHQAHRSIAYIMPPINPIENP